MAESSQWLSVARIQEWSLKCKCAKGKFLDRNMYLDYDEHSHTLLEECKLVRLFFVFFLFMHMGSVAPWHVGSFWIRDQNVSRIGSRFFTTEPPGSSSMAFLEG